MTNTAVAAPRAGWYQDPRDEQSWRWWDGDAWTTHTQSKAPVAPSLSTLPFPVAAGPTQAPAVTFADRSSTSSGNVRFSDGTFGSWSEIESAQTIGIWLLAFSPIISVLASWAGFYLGVRLAVATGGAPMSALVLSALFALGVPWIFAGADISTLRRRGYQKPNIAWMLLFPPLAYFIVRGRSVRRDGGRAWPPEVAYALTTLVIIAFWVLVAIGVANLIATHGTFSPATITTNV